VDAESAIHRHKLALRERFERQKAASRFKPQKEAVKAEKTVRATKEPFQMKRSIQEAAKSPEAASRAAEDVMEEAARQNPKQAESIGKQKEAFKETAQETQKKAKKDAESLAETIKKAKSPKDAQEAVKSVQSKWEKWWGGRKEALPKLAMSFLYGAAVDTVKNTLQETTGAKIPVRPIYAALAIGGVSRSGISAGGGYMGAQLSSWLWKEGRISSLKTAILERNRPEIERLKAKYGPKIFKEAKERAESESRSKRSLS
jgi:hypothetical protein